VGQWVEKNGVGRVQGTTIFSMQSIGLLLPSPTCKELDACYATPQLLTWASFHEHAMVVKQEGKEILSSSSWSAVNNMGVQLILGRGGVQRDACRGLALLKRAAEHDLMAKNNVIVCMTVPSVANAADETPMTPEWAAHAFAELQTPRVKRVHDVVCYNAECCGTLSRAACVRLVALTEDPFVDAVVVGATLLLLSRQYYRLPISSPNAMNLLVQAASAPICFPPAEYDVIHNHIHEMSEVHAHEWMQLYFVPQMQPHWTYSEEQLHEIRLVFTKMMIGHAAAHGCREAQVDMARYDRKSDRSYRWLRLAAEHGNANAWHVLGLRHAGPLCFYRAAELGSKYATIFIKADPKGHKYHHPLEPILKRW